MEKLSKEQLEPPNPYSCYANEFYRVKINLGS